MNPEFLSSISAFIERAVGFAGIDKDELDGDLIARTHDAALLMARILTQGRVPLRQQGLSSSASRRSRVIAIASANHGDGATTTAINCAIELNLLGKKVLLIDAHHQLPAVAILLGERNLNGSEPNRVSPLLEVFELTSENAAAMTETLIDACSRTDFVIIDCGLIPKAVEATILQDVKLANKEQHNWSTNFVYTAYTKKVLTSYSPKTKKEMYGLSMQISDFMELEDCIEKDEIRDKKLDEIGIN
jgi:hypothetical protein